MFQLVVIAGIILAFVAMRRIRQQPAEKRPSLTIKYILYGLLIAAIALVVTGKVHWITAAIAGVVPLIQRLLPLVIRALPFLHKFSSSKANEQTPPTKAQPMDVDQALKVFGFEQLPDKAAIVQRHRELIQKNHPDRGGSDYLASQINEAKDILLKSLSK